MGDHRICICPKHVIPRLLLPAILLIAGYLRFMDLGLVRHHYDDSYPSYDAVRMLDTGQPIVIGQPSSIFLDNPAMMSYLQVLPLLLWRSPWSVYIFVIALNTAAVGFVYIAGQRVLGETVGLVGAFLFAVNPWMVQFSRATWVQGLVPFYMAVAAWGLWSSLKGDRRSSRRLWTAMAAVTMMVASYVQAFGFLIQLAILLFLYRSRLPRRVLLMGIAPLMAFAVIYGAAILGNRDRNLGKLADFVSSSTSLYLTREGIDHAGRLVSGRDFEFVWAREPTPAYEARRAWSQVSSTLLEVALLAGCLSAVGHIVRRDEHRDTATILLVWLAVPVLLMTVTSKPVHIHYLMLSAPAGTLCAAWALSSMDRCGLRWLAAAPALALIALSWSNLHAANRFVAESPTPDAFNDWSLTAGSRVGATIRRWVADRSEQMPPRIYADGDRALLSSLSATYVEPVRGLDFPDFVMLPADAPMLYVLTDQTEGLEELPSWFSSVPGEPISIDRGAQVDFLESAPLSESDVRELCDEVVGWSSEAGLEYVGLRLNTTAQPGKALSLTAVWRVAELLPDRVAWYVTAIYRLTDGTGSVLAESGGHGQWGYRWQLRDTYVERFTLTVPDDIEAEGLRLQAGLFDPLHGRIFYFETPEGRSDAASVPIAVVPQEGGLGALGRPQA